MELKVSNVLTYDTIRDVAKEAYANMRRIRVKKIGYAYVLQELWPGCCWQAVENHYRPTRRQVYTFKIRPEVYFSDGEVCDAYAIKANFDAIIENKERHTWLEMMQLLVSVEVPDQDTLVITMSAPYYPMLTELGVTRPFAMISPKAMKDGSTKDGVEAYIGTGPYILTDFVTDEYAVFERNENYWGQNRRSAKSQLK